MLTQEDKDLLLRKGISEEKIAEQLACFEKGFPYLKLYAAASVVDANGRESFFCREWRHCGAGC